MKNQKKVKKKICNQLFLKDEFRERKYPATVKCTYCGEQSSLQAIFPFPLEMFTNFLEDFVKLHSRKGCNKKEISSPAWASKEVNLGIAG